MRRKSEFVSCTDVLKSVSKCRENVASGRFCVVVGRFYVALGRFSVGTFAECRTESIRHNPRCEFEIRENPSKQISRLRSKKGILRRENTRKTSFGASANVTYVDLLRHFFQRLHELHFQPDADFLAVTANDEFDAVERFEDVRQRFEFLLKIVNRPRLHIR